MFGNLKATFRAFSQAFTRFNQGNQLRAAALSFFVLLSVFPLTVLLLSSANLIWGEDVVTQWAERLTQRFFPGDLPAMIIDGIATILQNEQSLNVVALIGLIWGATSFFSNLTLALDLTFNPDTDERPIWHKRLFGSLMIVVLALLLGMTVVVAYSLRVFVRSLVDNPGAIMRVLSLLIPLVLDILLLSLLFRYVPRTHIKWRAVLIGAVFGAVGFEISRGAFAWYLENLANYSALYGSLGAVIALLIWVYLSLAILLYSAELSAVYAKSDDKLLTSEG